VDADEVGELLKGFDALLEVKANPTQFKNFEVRYTTRGELQLTAFSSRQWIYLVCGPDRSHPEGLKAWTQRCNYARSFVPCFFAASQKIATLGRLGSEVRYKGTRACLLKLLCFKISSAPSVPPTAFLDLAAILANLTSFVENFVNEKHKDDYHPHSSSMSTPLVVKAATSQEASIFCFLRGWTTVRR